MFRVAERAVTLADPDLFPVFARPRVHVPEYVAVDAPVMFFGQLAGRHRLIEPLSGYCCLEEIECRLRAEITAILENGCSGIAVGVVCAVIHRQATKVQPYLL